MWNFFFFLFSVLIFIIIVVIVIIALCKCESGVLCGACVTVCVRARRKLRRAITVSEMCVYFNRSSMSHICLHLFGEFCEPPIYFHFMTTLFKKWWMRKQRTGQTTSQTPVVAQGYMCEFSLFLCHVKCITMNNRFTYEISFIAS